MFCLRNIGKDIQKAVCIKNLGTISAIEKCLSFLVILISKHLQCKIMLSYFQEINISGSNQVSDQGISNLFGYTGLDHEPKNQCSKSLKYMKMRSTGVRVLGVRILLFCAVNLQGRVKSIMKFRQIFKNIA